MRYRQVVNDRVPETDRWWLGFDIGGTRTKAGIVSDDGGVRQEHIEETTYEPFERVWEHMLGHADDALASEGARGFCGIGIAAPGLVDPHFGVRNLPGKVLGIEDFPLRERLEDR